MADPDRSARLEDGPDEDRAVLERYRRLRAVARQLLASERGSHSLRPTDLVHEALARLSGGRGGELDRDDQMRLVATTMRHVLVDHARARACQKRGGGARRLGLDALDLAASGSFEEIVAIDDAIERLAEHDAKLAELVRLRFFAGYTVEETAQALGSSPRTVNRDWSLAKVLLLRLVRAGG